MEKFVEYSNTQSNSPECNGDKVTDTSKSFSEYEPDIILRNGMRLYNVRQNPDDIDVLQNIFCTRQYAAAERCVDDSCTCRNDT